MERYPALYYGTAMIAGIALSYGIWPPFILIILSSEWRKWCGFTLVALFAFLETLHLMPTLPEGRVDGIGYYKTEKIQHIDRNLSYRGTVSCFIAHDHTYYDIPCVFFRNDLLPKASEYIVRGSLRPTQRGVFTLHATFEPMPNSYNLSFLRFHLKERFRKYLRESIDDDICYSFFASLGTGEIESRLLGYQFSKVGLTHTLAISGFHYTWLIFIIGSLLHLVLSKRKTCYLMLVVISLYFLFIGETPSLNRAWLAALICITGYLLKESVNGLNSLGLAFLISLILDPFALFQIGFQLSYLATFSLLAIYPSFDKWLQRLILKRRGWRYAPITFCRETLALTFAVNLTTLPLLLHHFHYFPYLSFFFNLFFPLAITPCMIALIFSPIPFVLKFAEWYISPFLNMIFYGVDRLEWCLFTPSFPLSLLTPLLIGIFSLGIYLTRRDDPMYSA